MLEMPVAAAGTAAGAAGASSSSSSSDRPSLIMRWMRSAYAVGSSSWKPDVSSDVSNIRNTRSLTALSFCSASTRRRSSFTMAWCGLISIVFFDIMYDDMLESRSAWLRMICSMCALQPNSDVTRMHGDVDRRSVSTTFSTLSPRISFIALHSFSKLAFSSSRRFFSSSDSSNFTPSFVRLTNFLSSKSFTCCITYSSMGSTMNSTSTPRRFASSRKGEFSSFFLLSPVM
mmetsp:Transcript_27094/g.48600  ORF Transcript_27094/g.48600 Transcript_27094/m.48600 type:complete len:230 (-) Transcript_27094:1486-2175(-)